MAKTTTKHITTIDQHNLTKTQTTKQTYNNTKQQTNKTHKIFQQQAKTRKRKTQQ